MKSQSPLQSPQSQLRKEKRSVDLTSQTIRMENGRIITRNVRQIEKDGKQVKGVIEYKGGYVPVLRTSDGRNGTAWVMNSAVVAGYPATPPTLPIAPARAVGDDEDTIQRFGRRYPEEQAFGQAAPVVLNAEQLAFQLGRICSGNKRPAPLKEWRELLREENIPFAEEQNALGPVMTIINSAWSIHFDLYGKFLYANHGAEKQTLAEALGAIGQ